MDQNVKSDITNQFLKEVLKVMIKSYNTIEISYVRESNYVPLWYSQYTKIPYMANLEKAGILHITYAISLNGTDVF